MVLSMVTEPRCAHVIRLIAVVPRWHHAALAALAALAAVVALSPLAVPGHGTPIFAGAPEELSQREDGTES